MEKKKTLLKKVLSIPGAIVALILSGIGGIFGKKLITTLGALVIVPLAELVVGANAEPWIKENIPWLLPVEESRQTSPKKPLYTQLGAPFKIKNNGYYKIKRKKGSTKIFYRYSYDEYSYSEEFKVSFSNRSTKDLPSSSKVKVNYKLPFCIRSTPYTLDILETNKGYLKAEVETNSDSDLCI